MGLSKRSWPWTRRSSSWRSVGILVPSGAATQEDGGVSVTVYNQNFGLVKDVRVLDLDRGVQEIRIDDVAASIDATSVHFAALDHSGDVAVLEQNYQYDLAGADFIPLILDSPYSARILEDWILQAKLCMYCSDSMQVLRPLASEVDKGGLS